MDYIRSNYKNFSIGAYYKNVKAEFRETSEEAFKSTICKICNFELGKKSISLIEFAHSIRDSKFEVLKSQESELYWNDVLSTRTVNKRLYAHLLSEDSVVEAIQNHETKKNKTLERHPNQEEPQSHNNFRVHIFKSGYAVLKNQPSESHLETVDNVIATQQPVSLADHLDHLAHSLLKLPSSSEREMPLKLSISRILYLVGGPTLPIQKNYFLKKDLSANLIEYMSLKPILGPGLSQEMSSVYGES
ncbi:hypothetical protein INT47_006261 [Mucor saturninus]|uniref:Uncharacterized protein n=1 Tax=Mucor saturninus TaxID=64648 RepID=A0A8H7R095_9FUNG|nr:hypothetical protein INT47_006261 [Mucor saturninus]